MSGQPRQQWAIRSMARRQLVRPAPLPARVTVPLYARSPRRGKGMAVASLVLGLVAVAVAGFTVLLWLFTMVLGIIPFIGFLLAIVPWLVCLFCFPLWFFCGVLGLIFGIVALARARKTPLSAGRGMAIAGVATSAFALAALLAVILLVVLALVFGIGAALLGIGALGAMGGMSG